MWRYALRCAVSFFEWKLQHWSFHLRYFSSSNYYVNPTLEFFKKTSANILKIAQNRRIFAVILILKSINLKSTLLDFVYVFSRSILASTYTYKSKTHDFQVPRFFMNLHQLTAFWKTHSLKIVKTWWKIILFDFLFYTYFKALQCIIISLLKFQIS